MAWAAPPGPVVNLPDKGTYYWWESSAGGGVVSPPKAVSGATQFTAANVNGGTLYVLDIHTGEIAALPAPVGKTAVLLKFADFHPLGAAEPIPAAVTKDSLAASAPAPPLAATTDTGGESLAGRIASWVIGLLVLIGVIWVFKRIWDSRGKVLTDSARRLGVDVPDPAEISAQASANQPEGVYVPPAPRAVDKVPEEVLAAAGAPPVNHAWGAPLPDPIPHLVGLDGPTAGQRYDISSSGMSVGREEGNQIAIVDPSVSRRHASILPQGLGFVLRDEGSANGVFVNGQKVSEQPLRAGDTVQIGRIRFRYEDR